jgi:Uri superfamily endonuclease
LEGIYVLIICLRQKATIKIGALGELSFEAGTYAYVGSAQKNLEQRVKRQLRNEKRLFWHIDYLLSHPAAKVIRVLYKQGKKAEECAVATQVGGCPIVGFGCSDCHCQSHLFRLGNTGCVVDGMQEVTF